MRIISLAPSNTEILFALGTGDNVVGATNFCDYPPEVKKFPKVGSWINAHDMSRFEELRPDYILSSMYVPDVVREWAREKGVQLVHVYPQTLEGIYESIRSVGKIVYRESIAERIISNIKMHLASVSLLVRSDQKRECPKVYSEEFHEPPTVGANWVPELIRIAGGTPMAKEGILSYAVTAEDVAAFDPDLIALHWCGFGERQRPDLVKKRKGWEALRAVRENKIVVIDDTFLNRPGPRIWKGAELLKKHFSTF